MSATTKSLNLNLSRDSQPKPSRIDLWFPDRQILVRGPGKIAAIQLKQSHQLAATCLLAALLLGLIIATAGLVIACAAEARIARTAEHLHAALTAAQAQTARAEAEYATAAQARDQAVAAANRASALAITQATGASQRAIAAALQARDAAVAQAERASAAAIARANQTIAANDALLNGLMQQTDSTLGAVNLIFKSTGLDPVALAAQPGPPLALSPTTAHAEIPPPRLMPAAAAQRADLLLSDLARLRLIGAVLAQLPLTSPTAQAVISSGFGMRASPFTGAPEFHVGIDLPGPIGAPVYATAPGTVTYAGWSTGYGNLITIDHGYGLSTRYSHLNKILVKVGATVTLHQEIGLMGNTGWSTGPHLLYETRVDGKPRNPTTFIKVNPYNVQN
jgi:murein DD-endopeptidase MepM/ murein hydrolase activator NlpD